MFEKLFGWTTHKEEKVKTSANANVVGRYSDNNKNVAQLEEWEKSNEAFEAKNFMEAYAHFFKYLIDPSKNNVILNNRNGKLEFEILQGSKIIRGICDEKGYKAKGNIAIMKTPSVAVMRKLLNQNFTLNYSRFCIDDENTLCIRSDAKNIGLNPSKLYYSLKELSVRCDRLDDALKNEFSNLEALDRQHITEKTATEIQYKYEWLQKSLETTISRVKGLDMEKDNGAISYLIMAMIFRIDYLLVPEGKTLEYIYKITDIYYDPNIASYVEKNRQIIALLEELKNRTIEDFKLDQYNYTSTFSSVNPINYQSVIDSIVNSNKNHDWYVKNNFPDAALCCPEYGFAYCRFAYSTHAVFNELFDVFMNILHTDFYKNLGIDRGLYNVESKIINREKLIIVCKEILDKYKSVYPNINLVFENIKTDDLLQFALSFSDEVTYLNFNK